MQIRKAIIPAAGFGTRFLPASKAIPKELLPLVDRPMIHYAVAEAVAAGISHIIIVTSRGKEALASYFSPAPELEAFLRKRGDLTGLEEVQRLYEQAQFSYVPQREQRGLGDAVLTARSAVGEEPFAVLLPDDIITGSSPAIGQLIEVAGRYGASVVAVEEVSQERLSAYGIVEPRPVESRVYQVLRLVEKPPPGQAPSNLAIVGRYVFTPLIFDAIQRVKPGAGGEIQLTDSMSLLLEQEHLYAYRFPGTRYDAGTPQGLLQASLELALAHPNLGPEFQRWLRDKRFQS